MANIFLNLICSLVVSWCLLVPGTLTRDALAAEKTPLLSSRHKFHPSRDVAPGEGGLPVRVDFVEGAGKKNRPSPTRATAELAPGELRDLLSSKSAIVLDSRSGATLYAHNPDTPGQPASTIKVLTGLIAIQSLNGNDKVMVSRYAANMPRSKIYLLSGKRYYADDLINAVLLSSANDASVALAEKLAGNEKTFAVLMTEKAREMGASNTLCKSASGLTRRDQRSTARDLAVIFNEAMKESEFVERISLKKVKTRDGKVLRTHNKALWNVEGAIGGKTGYTRAARQTYVGKFKRGEDELVVAIMGSETMWDDIGRLVEYGFVRKQNGGGAQLADNGGADAGRMPIVRSIASNRQLAAIEILNDSKKESKL